MKENEPTMTNQEISPAACAVLDVLDKVAWDWSCMEQASPRDIAAAVIRAVADQVVPPDPCGDDCCITQCEQIRAELLAIADEL